MHHGVYYSDNAAHYWPDTSICATGPRSGGSGSTRQALTDTEGGRTAAKCKRELTSFSLCERLFSSYTPQSRHTSLLDMGRAYKHRLEANLTEFDAYTAVPLCERCRVWGTGTQPHTVYARAARMSATTDGPTRQSPHPAHPRKHTKHESWVQSARERVRQCARGG